MAHADNTSLPNPKLVELFQQTHEEALQKNEENAKFLIKNRDEYLNLKSQLAAIPNKLSHDVMVPIGARALMRGKIVHTNEILVCLGDGWFVKQSANLAAEICSRRIQSCSEVLSKLEQERNLLTSRKQLPFDKEAFGLNDIKEPYDEKFEAEWKIHHRQKERQYRQQLAKQREEGSVNKHEDEAFWEKLERLELQEELEEELERLNKKRVSAGNIEATQTPRERDVDQLSNGPVDKFSVMQEEKRPLRRVSFADIHKDSSDDESDSSDEPLSIEFSHTPPQKLSGDIPLSIEGQTILSPADIYNMFPKSGIKSILKQNSNTSIQNTFSFHQSHDEPVNDYKKKVRAVVTPAFGDVLEHQIENGQFPAQPINFEKTRPLSRFQAARQCIKK